MKSKMQYRELGNTGLSVSEIGMGCEGFGGDETREAKRRLTRPSGSESIILISTHPIRG